MYVIIIEMRNNDKIIIKISRKNKKKLQKTIQEISKK